MVESWAAGAKPKKLGEKPATVPLIPRIWHEMNETEVVNSQWQAREWPSEICHSQTTLKIYTYYKIDIQFGNKFIIIIIITKL
jgi:hypothetical protein